MHWICSSSSRITLFDKNSRAMPIAEVSSSVVPSASKTASSLGLRSPLNSPDEPLSPVRVYIKLAADRLEELLEEEECTRVEVSNLQVDSLAQMCIDLDRMMGPK